MRSRCCLRQPPAQRSSFNTGVPLPPTAGSINIANGKTNPACTTFGPLDATWRCAPFCAWAAGQGQLIANLGEHAALGVLRCAGRATYALCCAGCAVPLCVLPCSSNVPCRGWPSTTSHSRPCQPPAPSPDRLEDSLDGQHRHQAPAQQPRGLLSGSAQLCFGAEQRRWDDKEAKPCRTAMCKPRV